MASNGALRASPLRQEFDFNWIFLVILVVCGILSLFFLFYFNRLFATLVSYGLRAWTWHRYRVYIDIQHLQISLLGGRIFFKGFRYHGNNETILIHTGHVTWCYWLRNVRELNLTGDSDIEAKSKNEPAFEDTPAGQARSLSRAEGGGAKKADKLPCRLNVSAQGAEWFVYNRSAAYDAIVIGLTRDEHAEEVSVGDGTVDTPDENLRKRTLRSKNPPSSPKDPSLDLPRQPPTPEKYIHSSSPNDPKLRESSSTMQTEGSVAENMPPKANTEGSFILRLLPIHIDCQKAAVVLGNENTKSVLITKADKVSGEIDATKPLNPIDQYRQMFNFEFERPVVQMKPNDDYKEDQTAAAIRIKRGTEEQPEPKKPPFYSHFFWHRQRRKAWHKLQDLVPRFRSSVESFSSSINELHLVNDHEVPGSHNWQGLSRYLEEGEQDDRARWSSVEYATVTTIADCPRAKMSFYWDVVGTVQETPSTSSAPPEREAENINGNASPEWGLNLSMEGAIINYGPWADRQRANIQRVFFPTLCKDSVPSNPLVPGQFRVPTEFKVYIELEKETILRVPIREESKNWKWTKHADTMGVRENSKKGSKSRRRKADKGEGVETRPFGWLDVKVGPNATVSYSMDMMAGQSGFCNGLQLDLPSVEVTTSVNHGLLMRSGKSVIACDLSNPLQWNGHHTWIFDINSRQLELFILREHIFLFIDLVDDWASGPPPDFLTFSPFKYIANLHLYDFKIYLNVNDANIINNPSNFDDNTFISIFGKELNAHISIPLESYRPHRNDIPLEVDARDGGLKLHVPPWNTQATFLSSNEIATLKELLIDGTYQYCATTSPANTDTLILNVHGDSPTAQLYGFVIRYYLKVKDNYFGEDIHFKTLEEYQKVLRAKREDDEDYQNQQPFKKSNDLDVVLSVSADNTHALLPANLYSSKNHIDIEIASLSVDLRFTNYYMDLDVAFKTLAFSQGNEIDGATTPNSTTSSTQLFIDGINICGNRLFGLPPTEPTYVCNWDFSVGRVTGECTVQFLSRLASGGRALAFSFDDDENSLPLTMDAILHDVTFLRATIESVQIWMHIEEAAFLFSTGCLSVNFNDWAGSHYSTKLVLKVPDLRLSCVDAESASRHRSRAHHPVETHLLLQTTVTFAMIQRKLGFAADRQLQQEHIKYHDQRTHRTDFLLHPQLLGVSMFVPIDAPAMFVPPMPVPVLESSSTVDDNSTHSNKSIPRSKRAIRRQSSFLSMSTTSLKSNESVLRPRSPKKSGDSIPTGVRSRSLRPDLGSSHGGPRRDVSSSTGRKSSFYSAMGEARGLPLSSVTFSSSYMAPYFPLEGVEPDVRDLPTITQSNSQVSQDWVKQTALDDIDAGGVDESTEHVSFVLELPLGVRFVLNPQAVDAAAGVLAAFQAVDPADILDGLQIEAMNGIFDINKQKKRSSKMVDFHMETPGISVRFLNSSESNTSATNNVVSDQYDLYLGNIAVSTRSKTFAPTKKEPHSAEDASAVHLAISSINISAKERCNDFDDPQVAADIMLQDMVFWMVANKARSLNLRFRDLQITTASSKIEYLASLIHRTKVVASSLADNFSSRTSQQRSRVQLFTYLVVTLGNEAPDPSFLTRPSYVLRSADNHLRTTDSWKVVTRLHHMYANLAAQTQQDIIIRCLEAVEFLPNNAQQTVLATFDQWRSWDLNSVQDCLVMRGVYGTYGESPEVSKAITPFKFTVSTRRLRLLLDPGPKQNEISLYAMSAVAESPSPNHRKTDITDPDAFPHQITMLQVICPEASLFFNWELYELVDAILRVYDQVEKTPQGIEPVRLTLEENNGLTTRHEIHITIATGNISTTVDTINLKGGMVSEGLKGSLVVTSSDRDPKITLSTLLLSADATTTKLSSHYGELMVYQLRYPSLFAAYEPQSIGTISSGSIFKLAANCQQLSFMTRQEILVLVEVVDLVLGDEIRQIYKLQSNISERRSSRPQPKDPAEGWELPVRTKISIALFLDEYSISLPLLHSLVYDISGVVARVSIAAQLSSEIILDFDIKENVHYLKSSRLDTTQSISALHIPPTNGRITSHMSAVETTISVLASIEPIEFDATALHGLTSALNRPEISGIVSDVQDDINALQGHIEEIFGRSKKPPITVSPPETKLPLVYDVHVTWAGLNIYANAQGDYQHHSTSRLDFKLGCIQLLFANRLDQRGPVLDHPELRVGLQHIGFELARWNNDTMEPCGNLSFTAFMTATSRVNDVGDEVRSFHLHSDGLDINLFANTASSVVDIMGYLQDKIKDLDFTREKKYLRKLRKTKPRITINEDNSEENEKISSSTIIFASMYSLELLNIQVSWIVGADDHAKLSNFEPENLVLSLKRIDLSTRKENSARLTITDLQLQMVPASYDKTQRSFNSALLPEVIFNVGYVSTINARRLAFQAAGKSLDLRLTSQFILPAAELQKSINSAVEKVRIASEPWITTDVEPTTEEKPRQPFFGKKRMESLLIDADFAGAVVYLSGKKTSNASGLVRGHAQQAGRYGQFSHNDASSNTVLRAPGLAWKIEYKDNGLNEPSLNAEVKVDASNNILYPVVVPLIMEISSTVRDIVSDDGESKKAAPQKSAPQKFLNVEDDNILAADPSAVLGRTRLNLGLRICRQEFSLSCQPIARVAAVAKFEDIYLTINTVRSTEHGHFFAASAAFTKLQASVQHVYSRESTGSFDVDSVFLSLMNSKHVSGTSGLSAILKISPMKVLVNAKQLQDFLLFREIWVPPEIRQRTPTPPPATPNIQNQTILVQRYQQVAATGAFPWNATISIAELDVQMDLGQAIGKSAFIISNFWISSKKNSDWEQNLCLGFDKIGVDSAGRMSGFVALQNFKLRTSIRWPAREMALNQTPLVQGSLAFSQFRVKAAFDYQAFLVADITSFEFLMYNVRNQEKGKGDRLVAILDGEAVQLFATTTSASQALALYQAFRRLVQEKRSNYEASLAEIERFMKRKSVAHLHLISMPKIQSGSNEDQTGKSPISLHTDVIVTLKAVNIGAFPNAFTDHQIFKLEALNAQARFAVTMDAGKIHSILGLTLGQLRIGLAGIKRIEPPKTVGELLVEDVVTSATGSRGGTILKVPKVEAVMQTWQVPGSNHIDYIFKSSFEGKVEVGWNYSRISYIRSMWASHSKALAQRLGKPLPPSAVKITGVPGEENAEGEQQKITAEVNVPVSKYDYTALEPPIIETPQLRDMGEATPPLEWIGLHRDRLPNLTHQIVIVTLLEVASEVEDAYGKILGST